MINGYILAGGASRRMGRNKSLLLLNCKTLVERAYDSISAIASQVSVVGDVGTEGLGLPVVPDISDARERRGSIIGLVSALRHCSGEWAAVIACDLPFVTADLMRRLADISKIDERAGCVVPVQPDGRVQPLCAIYRKASALPAAEECLRDGEWRLRGLIDTLDTRLVQFREIEDLPGASNFFFNVNTAADYERAVRIAESEIQSKS